MRSKIALILLSYATTRSKIKNILDSCITFQGASFEICFIKSVIESSDPIYTVVKKRAKRLYSLVIVHAKRVESHVKSCKARRQPYEKVCEVRR